MLFEREVLIGAIFALTYLVIAVQRLPGVHIDRPSGVMVGATLLLLTGGTTLPQAYRAIDGDVLVFLLGMMILIAYLEQAGFLEQVAWHISRHVRTPGGLLGATIAASALLSALLVNDTVCLLFPPLLLRVTRRLDLDPVPFLLAVALAANFGSALTITGNPQNMYIGVQSGLEFLPFAAAMALPVGVALLLTWAALRRAYPHLDWRRALAPEPLPPPAFDRVLAAKSLLALGVTVVLFIGGAGYPLSALVGASGILLAGRVPPRAVLQRLDWTVLLFFAGLFVVMGAVEQTGAVAWMLRHTAGWFASPHAGWALGGLSVVLSNAVSNVPAVILLRPLVEGLGSQPGHWLILSLSATFAGNLTLVGSVANLIVAEQAQAAGVRIGFWAYLRVGLPLTLVSLAVGLLWLLWWGG